MPEHNCRSTEGYKFLASSHVGAQDYLPGCRFLPEYRLGGGLSRVSCHLYAWHRSRFRSRRRLRYCDTPEVFPCDATRPPILYGGTGLHQVREQSLAKLPGMPSLRIDGQTDPVRHEKLGQFTLFRPSESLAA
jgi:hypothetical protein